MRAKLGDQRVELSTYLTLYVPALDWILQCLADRASESLLGEVLFKCKDRTNR